MFYISGYSNGLFSVTDTKDKVAEYYSFKDLKLIKSSGIDIVGLSNYSASVCKQEGNFIFVTSLDDNSLLIYDINNGVLCSSLNFNDLINDRGNTLICDGVRTKISKDGRSILVRCLACVKYDYEFTGLVYVEVNKKTGRITDKTDEILFINDDDIDSISEATCGDCPDFITSEEANSILKRKGMV